MVFQGSCTTMNCPVGTYVDPQQGCLVCNTKFPGSTLCNYTHALKCNGKDYLFSNDACVHCSNMNGYTLNSRGECV